MTGIEQIMERYTSDPAFKETLRKDPEAAARQAGISLTPEEQATLKGMDWNLPDEQLQQRISKHKRFN